MPHPFYWQDAQTTLESQMQAARRVGLLTDVDGTISPIVSDPAAAVVTPRARQLLADLQPRLTLLGAISGRAATDLPERVGLTDAVYVGNHGFERWQRGQITLAPEAVKHRPALDVLIAGLQPQLEPGMHIEDKGATLSVHYRNAADSSDAQARFAPVVEALALAHHLDFFQGRMVFEVRPPVTINKGTALVGLVREYALDLVFWLGDDTTDADAMLAGRELRANGVVQIINLGVTDDDGYAPAAILDAADYLVNGVPGVEAFLEWLRDRLNPV